MSTVERYEKVRADWLLANEMSWTLSDRRMANALKRRTARKDLTTAGAAESSHHEGKIKPIWSRFLAAGEDSTERMFRSFFLVLFIVPGVLLGLGPALVVSQTAYKVTTEAHLSKGRVPKRGAWFIAGAVVAVAGVVLGLLIPSLVTVATARFYPDITLTVHWDHVGLIYSWAQVTLALLLTGWEIRRHGWPGVIVKGEAKLPTIPGGNKVPAVPESTAHTEPEPREQDDAASPPKVPAIPVTPLPDTPEGVEDDEEPAFDEDELIEYEPADDR